MSDTLRGWKFPVEIDPLTGKFKTAEGDEDIREAIRIILTTKKGERIGSPAFGSNLFNFMFASINYTELKELEYEIKESLRKWEPRIKDLEVKARVESGHVGRVLVSIQYKTDHMVVPDGLDFVFEVNEGINF